MDYFLHKGIQPNMSCLVEPKKKAKKDESLTWKDIKKRIMKWEKESE